MNAKKVQEINTTLLGQQAPHVGLQLLPSVLRTCRRIMGSFVDVCKELNYSKLHMGYHLKHALESQDVEGAKKNI